jgi:transposase-like protein
MTHAATVSRCLIQSFLESDSDSAARVTVEIRLRAVTEVNDGAPVGEVAERYGVTRQTVTARRKRYEAGVLDAVADQSRRPHSSPAGSLLMSKR